MGGFFETRCAPIGGTLEADPLGATLEDAPLTPHPPNLTNPNQFKPNPTNPKEEAADHLLSVVPDSLRSPEIDEAVLHWRDQRSEGAGDYRRPIGLDSMTLKTQIHKLGPITREQLFQALADAAAGGWKGLHLDRRRTGSSKGANATFAQQKSNGNDEEVERFIRSKVAKAQTVDAKKIEVKP